VSLRYDESQASVLSITHLCRPSLLLESLPRLAANRDKYAAIISDRFPFNNVLDALKAASTPGAADKVVVTFD
jgi:hypothetical protein